MKKETAFLEIGREETQSIDPSKRIKNFDEFIIPSSKTKVFNFNLSLKQ